MKIKIIKNGPYEVSGSIPLYKSDIVVDSDNYPIKIDNKEKIDTNDNYYLCRCGNSKNKPFCDGSHESKKFNGKEIAKKSFKNEDKIISESEKLIMIDIPYLCDHGRFCTRDGGISKLMDKGDHDVNSLNEAKKEASLCTSGRLTIIDKNTDKNTEKDFKKEITLLFDTGKDKEGPIWVTGGIPLESSDKKVYEVRNRMTLCRCGNSHNKPFCDGSHWTSEEFNQKFRKKWNLD